MTAEEFEKFELKKRYGYLLVYLDVEGVAPSIEYAKVSGSKSTSKNYPRARALDLKNKEKGFLLLPLSKGSYQIVRVNVPFFNLPYVVDISTDPEWHFTIESGKINYIGRLVIEKERTDKNVNIKLLNRIAFDYEEINKTYANVISHYPLVVSKGYRDDFLTDFSGKGQE